MITQRIYSNPEAPMTIAAIEKDIYVYLEKLMRINHEEIKILIEAEKKARQA